MISPLMTSPKKPNSRRAVFDASFGLYSLNKNTPERAYHETEYKAPEVPYHEPEYKAPEITYNEPEYKVPEPQYDIVYEPIIYKFIISNR